MSTYKEQSHTTSQLVVMATSEWRCHNYDDLIAFKRSDYHPIVWIEENSFGIAIFAYVLRLTKHDKKLQNNDK